jgi:hypothetical protein
MFDDDLASLIEAAQDVTRATLAMDDYFEDELEQENARAALDRAEEYFDRLKTQFSVQYRPQS